LVGGGVLDTAVGMLGISGPRYSANWASFTPP